MIPFIITFISALVRFWKFGHPAEVVFDEVHIGTFVADYMNGSYFFDIHPPLGRLLVALSGYMTGADSQIIDWSKIGNDITLEAVAMRIFPAIAGALLPLIIYHLAKRMGFSTTASATTSLLLAFESSLVVGSRFMMHDIFFVTFGFLSLLFYLKHPEGGRMSRFLFLSAVFVAFSISVKWLGLSFLAMICFMELRKFVVLAKEKRALPAIKSTLSAFCLYAGIIGIVYVSLFSLHFSLLSKSGRGDAYMSDRFQKTLVGSRFENSAVEPMGFWGKFAELNKKMFSSQKNLKAGHSYSSKWYDWPMMKRTIFYWRSDDGAERIYLIGNPVVYWFGTVSIAALAIMTSWRVARRRFSLKDKKEAAPMLILFGFAISFIPFAFIGRVLFLYHYFTPLILSALAIGFFVDKVPLRKRHLIATLLIFGAMTLFFQYSKIIYGLPMTEAEFKGVTIPSWR